MAFGREQFDAQIHLLLAMKWKNRDTNVIEQANISKFSQLDDVGTPLRL